MYSFKTTTTSVHWFMRTNNNFGQFTFKKIRGKNLLTFGELTERKIHNLHSRTVNIHSRSDDNTCTAPHSHTTILNRETNSYKYVTVIVGIPAVLRLLRISSFMALSYTKTNCPSISRIYCSALPSHWSNLDAVLMFTELNKP